MASARSVDAQKGEVRNEDYLNNLSPQQLEERFALLAADAREGEIAAVICQGISRFEQEDMGRGPKDSHVHPTGDLLVVPLQGVWTAAEQQLVKSLPAEKGRTLLKQVRGPLVETARPILEVPRKN